jgi:hypothetical protein
MRTARSVPHARARVLRLGDDGGGGGGVTLPLEAPRRIVSIRIDGVPPFTPHPLRRSSLTSRAPSCRNTGPSCCSCCCCCCFIRKWGGAIVTPSRGGSSQRSSRGRRGADELHVALVIATDRNVFRLSSCRVLPHEAQPQQRGRAKERNQRRQGGEHDTQHPLARTHRKGAPKKMRGGRVSLFRRAHESDY